MARKRSKNRIGEVLGLGDAPISPETSISTDHTVGKERTDEAHRRHHRMSEGADELTPEPSAPHRGSGATGIDMGSGGEGTDLE